MSKVICECSCHKDGEIFADKFHPCCKHSGKKYISSNGEIDMKRLGEFEKKAWEKGWKDLGF